MALTALLIPFSTLYRVVTGVRNALYDRGVFRYQSLGARTISIGNITTGGTGKTPLTAFVAEQLADHGENVCILTRGYGRRDPRSRVLVSDGSKVLVGPETGGDEPVELARKLLGKAIVIADADRVAAAKWAREWFDITAFVLDDGFQHRRAKRDVDIVCIDATDPFGDGHLLPSGRLREPLSALSRADVIVLTRSDLVDSVDEISGLIGEHKSEVPIFLVRSVITELIDIRSFQSGTGEKQSPDSIDRSMSYLAFCGIGNPVGFRRQLESEGFEIAGFRAFKDHHRYGYSDVVELEKLAAESGAAALLTTAKDAVKLGGLSFSIPVLVVEITPKIDDVEMFNGLLIAS